MSNEGDSPGRSTAGRTVDYCPFRRVVDSPSTDRALGGAVCELVNQLVDAGDDCFVPRAACEACVSSFEPTAIDPNPVVASLVYSAAETLLSDLDPASARYQRVSAQRDFADANLPRVLPHEDDVVASDAGCLVETTLSLDQIKTRLPLGRPRQGRPVQSWSVGVTTAPRRQPTIDRSVAGLVGCGWSSPHLFVDGQADLSDAMKSFPATIRSEPAGAWHNFFLALVELVERYPRSDGYLMAQDDARWPDAPRLAEYLSEFLWPTSDDCIVSLYTSADDTSETVGWRPHPERWKYGALAFIFPRSVARRMTIDPWLRKYGWSHGTGVAGIDCTIGTWAERSNIDVWHPTPSILQHVGHVSAIWRTSRAVGLRRASHWIGDG